MQERRKYKRLPIHLELEINQLYKQDYEVIEGLKEEIEVINVSKTGVGFLSKTDFPLSYYFNAKLDFGKGIYFYCVIKIIRKEPIDSTNLYGCEFVGLAEFLSNKVDEYEKILEE